MKRSIHLSVRKLADMTVTCVLFSYHIERGIIKLSLLSTEHSEKAIK